MNIVCVYISTYTKTSCDQKWADKFQDFHQTHTHSAQFRYQKWQPVSVRAFRVLIDQQHFISCTNKYSIFKSHTLSASVWPPISLQQTRTRASHALCHSDVHIINLWPAATFWQHTKFCDFLCCEMRATNSRLRSLQTFTVGLVCPAINCNWCPFDSILFVAKSAVRAWMCGGPLQQLLWVVRRLFASKKMMKGRKR